MIFTALFLVLGPAALLYLWLVNKAILRVPKEVREISPRRWTKKEIAETYERIERNPIDFTPHLPPKLDRRYIVVGSSGLVGGYMVLHLLQRGQSPESIRMVDFVPPKRLDVLRATKSVEFVQADITSEDSTMAAFGRPWPKSVADLPLTVLHTAAVINFTDRARTLLPKVTKVNLTGTANVLSAAKRAGADIFLATSSASIAIKPVGFWIWPWQRHPKNMFQFYGEDDAYAPLRDHFDYFGNYAVSKALAEKLVMDANSDTFKTGCIRPANGVYGTRYDHTVGTYLTRRDVPTWVPHIVQNFVHAEHVSLAHFDYERALLTAGNKVGGRSFVVTDPNPPITFSDIYTVLSTTSVTGFKATYIPPIFLLVISYPIELYYLLKAFFPILNRVLPELPFEMGLMQPTLFSISCAHVIATDAAAKKSIAEGGIGYKGVCSTLEGMCMEVYLWNKEHREENQQQSVDAQIREEIRNMATVPAAMGGG
ncbi:uncharacterized protein PV09_01453 [Verruconis gallopava]|uniref:3-beta hydroxysteroid dehydrogenase/isomerase domain-containing protein n=1 Tax=Verruconis gallopava TaxID=253628 RepID=A0A0D1Z3H3_9PEZI|nr:uncharacterized protein PV09_01453 [Verruconis gallopava]KIW07487.1 hypothetical protein PV09_01453 [Verruconis gallopava]